MNLVIDIGNTTGKIAVCEGTEIIESAVYQKITIREVSYFITAYNELKGAIFSSVANHSRELIDYLDSTFDPFLELNNHTDLPLKNKYKTRETLGYDRIAAVTGAHTIFPENNVLVIDAGTAITFDMVTRESEYIGGNISPGLSMRFRALNKYTSRLPLLDYTETGSEFLGNSTDEAIILGVTWGLIHEIEGYIHEVSHRFENLKVILTGVDANLFDKKLKSSIFVVSHLNLIGLNRILDHNARKIEKE